MRRLIKSDITSLFWDKSFLICLLFSVALGIFMPVIGYVNKIRYGEITVFEDGFFIFISAFSLLIPAFVSLFVGKSYDWGTIRNKICVGKTRTEVYLSFLVSSLAGTMILILSYVSLYSIFGVFLLENLDIGIRPFLLLLATSVLVLVSITALSVFVANISSSRVGSLVITLVLVIALLMVGSIAVQMLSEPEMITNSFTVVDGEFKMADPYPNPRYVKESQRWIWEVLRDSLLGGQVHQITALECNVKDVSIYSLISSLLLSFLGCIFFNKKDLK